MNNESVRQLSDEEWDAFLTKARQMDCCDTEEEEQQLQQQLSDEMDALAKKYGHPNE